MVTKTLVNEPEVIARSYTELYARYQELLTEFRQRKEINKILLETSAFSDSAN